jgi:cell division protein FtsB
MLRSDAKLLSRREKRVQMAALGWLLLLGGMAIAGPSGVLAWGENLSLPDRREAQIKEIKAERDELRNRVALLDPGHVDPDLAGELVRKNLNVVHPDEVVITLK